MQVQVVSAHALIARINRKLKPDQEMLRTTRRVRLQDEVGDHYVIDLQRNLIIHKHVDLEDFGRELGVLKPFERLFEGE